MSPVYINEVYDHEYYIGNCFHIRAKIIIFMFALLFLIISARSFYIQVVQSKDLKILSTKQNEILSKVDTDNIVINKEIKNKIATSKETSKEYLNVIINGRSNFDITLLVVAVVGLIFTGMQLFTAVYPLIRDRRVKKIIIKTIIPFC